MSSNIPANLTYGVYISQLIRISQICDIYVPKFCHKVYSILTDSLIRQGFWYSKLCKYFKKFVRRHYALSNKFGVV